MRYIYIFLRVYVLLLMYENISHLDLEDRYLFYLYF